MVIELSVSEPLKFYCHGLDVDAQRKHTPNWQYELVSTVYFYLAIYVKCKTCIILKEHPNEKVSRHKNSLFLFCALHFKGLLKVSIRVIGWCDGVGYTFRHLDCRASACCACSRCGWGIVWTFFSLVCLNFLLSPSLWETVRYRLKYCLKGPLNPKQSISQLKFP